jgi:hypothetical protein
MSAASAVGVPSLQAANPWSALVRSPQSLRAEASGAGCRELFGGSLEQCSAPGPAGTILGYPACVYGFVMYMLVAGISFWGLRSEHGTRSDSQPEGAGPFRKNLTRDELP